jgi:hypothetical protein
VVRRAASIGSADRWPDWRRRASAEGSASASAEQAREEAGSLPLLVTMRVIGLEAHLVRVVVPVRGAVLVRVRVGVLDVVVLVVVVGVLVRRPVGMGVRVAV